MFDTQPLWAPPQSRIDNAALTRFSKLIQPALSPTDYPALHQWSVNNREAFWTAMWDFAGIVGAQGGTPYLVNGDRLPGAKWFPNARLNYAENLLRRRDDAVALIGILENGERTECSYCELYLRVAQLAAALRSDGVVPGDRVAGYLPNVIATVVAKLRATSVGAVWGS